MRSYKEHFRVVALHIMRNTAMVPATAVNTRIPRSNLEASDPGTVFHLFQSSHFSLVSNLAAVLTAKLLIG